MGLRPAAARPRGAPPAGGAAGQGRALYPYVAARLSHARRLAAGLCPNPLEDEAGLAEFLLDLAEAFPRPPVVMGCMDEWVLAVARHHARLAGGYRIPFPDARVVEAVLDKGRLYARAGARFGLLAQEKVPVEAGGHVTLVGYADRSGRVAADFVGRRLAIYPPGSGTTCLVEAAEVEEVRAHGRRLLEVLGYYGIAEVEFVRDARDGTYRLIDLNTRPWKWIGLPVAAGVDLPWMAYAEAAGLPAGAAPPGQPPGGSSPPRGGASGAGAAGRDPLRWVYLRDYLALLRESRGGDQLSREAWEAVLRGDPGGGVVEAVWDPDDPGPAWRLIQNEVGARKYYCPC